MSQELRWKIAIVGEANVGKTSLLLRFTDQIYNDKPNTTTVIDSRKRLITINGEKEVSLQLFDTQGQERFRSMTAGFFRGAQAVVITYDVGNRQSFEKLIDWIQNIKLSTTKNCVIAICGNKIDIDSKLRQVTKEEGKSKADQEKYLFFETSAKDGTCVDEMFIQIANKINEAMESVVPPRKVKKSTNCTIL